MADLPDPLPRRSPSPGLVALASFAIAAVIAFAGAWGLAKIVEVRTAAAVTSRLLAEGYTWAHVETDGLIVALSGTAPNEALRFSAMNLAGGVVDSGRLRDGFAVTPAQSVAAPHFSVEMLRNDDEVQLIGLLPQGPGKDQLTAAAQTLSGNVKPMDMLDTASYPAPDGWQAALDYGMLALELLPRSKISVSANAVVITAIATSAGEKRSFEAALTRATPKGLPVTMQISAPRPVLTPFTLRFVKDAKMARFDACSADTDKARDRILAAAQAAGAASDLTCTVGLGVPSPSWADATSAAIATLGRLGAGTVTFSDADITLLAGDTVSQAAFDREIGELRAALPDVFSLDAKMPEQPKAAAAGPVEFTASRAAETHKVDLRGRLTDDRLQVAVTSFAKARFGADAVYVATRLDPELPEGWAGRVLAGLQSLAQLDHGTLLVRADTVEVAGVSGSQNASATISQLLSDRLGQGKTFVVNVTYDKLLDPLAALPTPQECLDRVHAVLTLKKISFSPGSAEIDPGSSDVVTALATALKGCNAVKMEIAGHTDAQGSAGGNLALSQARAQAVMVALQGRQVDVSGMRATGYGKGVPIADNGSDAGREANRRIEFTLIDAPTPAALPPLQADATVADPKPDQSAPAANPLTDPAAAIDDSPALAPPTVTKKPRPRPGP